MGISLEMAKRWKETLFNSIAIMDEKGRANPEGNSQMLWDKNWNELRTNLLKIIESINAYDDALANTQEKE